jgi:hypothetical protein
VLEPGHMRSIGRLGRISGFSLRDFVASGFSLSDFFRQAAKSPAAQSMRARQRNRVGKDPPLCRNRKIIDRQVAPCRDPACGPMPRERERN